MNKRPKRENIKKPSRYETTESSDNEGESAKRYKEQNETSVADEIRDIRKNLSQYENEELDFELDWCRPPPQQLDVYIALSCQSWFDLCISLVVPPTLSKLLLFRAVQVTQETIPAQTDNVDN